MSARNGGDAVISVEHLSKRYRLGVIGHRTLTHDLQSWWARSRGKDDPNAPIDPGAAQAHNPREEILALDDVSFEVRRGAVLGIIGRNGAGKSTLLKILSRVTAQSAGEVKIKGRVASLLEVGTGFHPELTGRENIYLNGAILGMKRGEIAAKFDAIVAFSELARFIDTPVKRYSSGMYVRLAFAVAAHLEPEIMLIDEVLAVGDYAFQSKCLGKMGEVAREGRTILFVSHNMNAIRSLCTSAVLLSDGSITATGRIADVIETYMRQIDSIVQGKSSLRWDPETAPGGEEIRLNAMRVRNAQGMETTTFQFDEEIIFEFEYTVLQPLSGFMFQFSFSTADGVDLFSTTDQMLRSNVLLPGVYQGRCTIPRNLLNHMTYEVRFAGKIPHFRSHIEIFTIAHIQVLGGAHGSYLSDWTGAIAPKADWDVDQPVTKPGGGAREDSP